MGHQIYATGQGNHDLGVCFTRGAWQVMHWIERFTPRVKPAGMSDWQWADQLMGSSEASEAAVRVADINVPRAFRDAKAAGLIDNEIDEDAFEQCRAFLAEVAARGAGIQGSY